MTRIPQTQNNLPPSRLTLEEGVNQLVLSRALPFEVGFPRVVTSQVDGRIRSTFQHRSFVSDVPAEEFRIASAALTSIVATELQSRNNQFVLTSHVNNPLPGFLTPIAPDNLLANESTNVGGNGLPLTARDTIRQNRRAAIEVQNHRSALDFVRRTSIEYPTAQIVVLAVSRDRSWQIRELFGQIAGQNAFVVDESTSRRTNGNGPRQRVVVGTPDSLADDTDLGNIRTKDFVFITDPRLLRREQTQLYLDNAQLHLRVFGLFTQNEMLNPAIQGDIIELFGHMRATLGEQGTILMPPSYQSANIDWNISGNVIASNPVEIVNYLDVENRRMRAIAATLSRPRFQTADSIVVVFPRRRSVDQSRSLNQGYLGLDLSNADGVMPTRLAITSDELRDVQLAGNAVVAWAGAREEGMDLNRALVRNRPATAQLQIVDLQDRARDHNRRRLEIVRTVAAWNRSRQRFYESLGYLQVANASMDALNESLLTRARQLVISNSPTR